MTELGADEVRALLDADDDELLFIVGTELLPSGSGFGSDDDDFSRRLAERWIDDHRDALRNMICLHPLVVRVLAEEDGRVKLTDLVAILGTLAAASNGLTVAGGTAVVVFLVKGGLPRLCGTAAAAIEPRPSDHDPPVRGRWHRRTR